jgi:hypothetical protein
VRLLKDRCIIEVQSQADFHCSLLSRYAKNGPGRIVTCSALTTRSAVEFGIVSLSLKYARPPLSAARYMPTLPFLQLISIQQEFVEKNSLMNVLRVLVKRKTPKPWAKIIDVAEPWY